jgi:hypothetical protein
MTRLPLQHKLGCYAVMVALYVTFLPRLARDVLIAAEQLLRRLVSFRRAAPISDTGGAASVTQARDSTQKRAA